MRKIDDFRRVPHSLAPPSSIHGCEHGKIRLPRPEKPSDFPEKRRAFPVPVQYLPRQEFYKNLEVVQLYIIYIVENILDMEIFIMVIIISLTSA